MPSIQKETEYAVGDLVFIRHEKNKLKGREMSRISDVYSNAGEI